MAPSFETKLFTVCSLNHYYFIYALTEPLFAIFIVRTCVFVVTVHYARNLGANKDQVDLIVIVIVIVMLSLNLTSR